MGRPAKNEDFHVHLQRTRPEEPLGLKFQEVVNGIGVEITEVKPMGLASEYNHEVLCFPLPLCSRAMVPGDVVINANGAVDLMEIQRELFTAERLHLRLRRPEPQTTNV